MSPVPAIHVGTVLVMLGAPNPNISPRSRSVVQQLRQGINNSSAYSPRLGNMSFIRYFSSP